MNEAIIESPFLTARRADALLLVLKKALRRGARVVINTKPPQEYEAYMQVEAEMTIRMLQGIGAEVLLTGRHHRKLVILDRRILWEGSLNILSQNDSCEIMRRIESKELALQTLNFIQINKFLQS